MHGPRTTLPGRTIEIVVPVLGRPNRARPLADSVVAAATVFTRLTFVCSPDDDAQIDACMNVGEADTLIVDWQPGTGDYAKKINAAARLTDCDYIFTGADDLVFRSGWDEAALATIGNKGVCGTNDYGNPAVTSGRHSTHSLVAMSYVRDPGATYLDGPGVVLHEGYDHQQIDNELVHAAVVRKQWAFSRGPGVEHHHPMWKQGVSMDSTYEKALRGGRGDQRLYGQRRRKFMVGRASSRVATGRVA